VTLSSGAVADGRANIVICNWRDLRHPEGGGSELYVETVARGLVALGNRVTLLCAHVAGAPRDEVRDGVVYRRRGGKLTVYLAAAFALSTRRVRPDLVLDVQNGVPFLSSLVTGRPVVALVHHVHREQWRVLYGARAAKVGWWVESRLGPYLYRNSRYITDSQWTRRELAELDVAEQRVSVVICGTSRLPASAVARSEVPRMVVLGRVVPHKRIEIAMQAVAELRLAYPGLCLDIVGRGYWESQLRAEARRLGIEDSVVFHGWVDQQRKVELLSQAWVQAVTSVKEGWSLVVTEAGLCRTPSIAFDDAGALEESIRHGRTGVIVHGGVAEFTAELAALLADADRRDRMGDAAREYALGFHWDDTVRGVVTVLDDALGDARPPESAQATG
jgi:glycosyltransferase involved in cell wall biosynthesis